jgi:hypothetical protein
LIAQFPSHHLDVGANGRQMTVEMRSENRQDEFLTAHDSTADYHDFRVVSQDGRQK